MARAVAVIAAVAVALLAVAGAGGAATQQTPKRGGTVVVARPEAEPACLDLLTGRCAPGITFLSLESVWSAVLRAPFEVGPDLTWRPQLVSRATYTTRPPFVVTYHIRPEAQWNDDVPVTAQDFVFTHRELLRSDSPDLGLRELHADVRTVRALGPKTVQVVLRKPLAGWHALFGRILPAHALRGQRLNRVWRDRIDDPRTGAPIASGPFLVDRWERGRQLTLVRNPDYWGPHPAYIDRLVVRFGVDDSDLAEEFRERRVDVVADGYPPALARSFQRAGARVVTVAVPEWEHLDFRIGPGGNPLLRKAVVRRAIAYGIDRAGIARKLARESHLTFRVLDSAVFLPQSRFYQPNWQRYDNRARRTRQLLERVGCRLGADGVYGCGGVRLSLRVFTFAGPGSIRPDVLELLQAQLRRAGVEVVPSFASQNVMFGRGGIWQRGDFDGLLFSWVLTGPDPGSAELFGCRGSLNGTGYCQRRVTDALRNAERTFSAERQARDLNRADVQLANDVPVLPLFQHANWVALQSRVRGFVPGTAVGALHGAENWWLVD